MASGRPDWYSNVALSGQYDDTLIPVLVDSSGHIISVMSGIASVAGEVDVNQLDSAREIQGKDGATLRSVAVDNGGRIIMTPYGTTTVEGTATVTQNNSVREIQGVDNVTLRTIAVDANGYIIGVMKGDYGGVLKTIATDANGIMKANLAVQSLPAMTVKPFYTETQYLIGEELLDPGETDTLLTINGKGIVLGGLTYTGPNDYHDVSLWYIDIDGVNVMTISLTNLQTYGLYSPGEMPFYILSNYPSMDKYYLGIQPGLTFEDSFVVRAHNSVSEAGDAFGLYLWYALTL